MRKSAKKLAKKPARKQEEQEGSSRQDQEADLFLEGGRVLNVYSGEIYATDVAIQGSRIAGIGAGYAGQKVRALGKID